MKKLVTITGLLLVFMKCLMAQQARIVEIMSDPEPTFGLPPIEYVELLILQDGVSTRNWTLEDASGRVGKVGNGIFNSGDWIVLCNVVHTEEFLNSTGVEPWPVLNNATDRIILRDGSGEVVDSITYFHTWHQGSAREGGKSLELINPHYICNPQDYWRSSMNESGGTPGARNSIFLEFISEGPSIKYVYAASDIHIWFDKSISVTSLSNGTISIWPEGSIRSVLTEEDHYIITTGSKLLPEEKYQLGLSDIQGCDGSISRALMHEFMVSDFPGEGDICINEILFDAAPGNSDYVEWANVSGRQISLRGTVLELISQTGKVTKTVIDSMVSIPVHDYVVITREGSSLLHRYPGIPENKILSIENLIKLPDTEGNLVLWNASGVQMDNVYYHKNFHHPALQETEDVALERLSKWLPARSRNNWASASQSDGFGTPGRSNSQQEPSDDILISLITEVGVSGFAQIVYDDLPVGSTLSAVVFDIRGRKTGDIVSEFIPGKSGAISFFFETAGIRSGGIYFVWVEILMPGGNSRRFILRVPFR